MTARTIISGLLLLTGVEWHGAAFLGVAYQAPLTEISGSFQFGRFHMRVMARNASQALSAVAIAFAESHRVVVFEQILLRRGFAVWRHQQNRHRVIQDTTRPKALIVLSRFQDSHISDLVPR